LAEVSTGNRHFDGLYSTTGTKACGDSIFMPLPSPLLLRRFPFVQVFMFDSHWRVVDLTCGTAFRIRP
jgi:hypothetical protein